MSNFRNQKEQKQIEITKEPDWGMLALWYGLTPRGFRKRRKAKGVSIRERVLSERDYGEIFYKCGLPPRLPQELHEWAESMSAAWFRLVPVNAV